MMSNDKNLKSTAKSKLGSIPAQPNFGILAGRFSNDQGNIEEDNHLEIEESIIEEEIIFANQANSPPCPLITSQTKGKSKMGLKMMKPPKPIRQQSPVVTQPAHPFHLKFDTLASSIKENEDNEHIKEEIGPGSVTLRTQGPIPEQIPGGSAIKSTINDETYDELYQIPQNANQRRPFSPPIKQREASMEPVKNSVSFKQVPKQGD